MNTISAIDKEWIESYTAIVLKADPPQDLAEGYDVSILLAVDVFSYASKALSFINDDPKVRVLEVMRYGQILWDYLCDFVETTDSAIVCQKIGFLSAAIMVSQWNSDQWFKDAVQDATAQIIKERGSELLKDPVPVYPTMDKDEVDRIIDQCDSNLVTEFFELFKEIKVFYVDPEKYNDPADAERHRKMMAIFNKMTQDSDK
jgi:hypothetical protein